MELRDFVRVLRENLGVLLFCGFLFAFLGVSAYFLPSKYIASGSFFVTRKVENPSSEFFTYEGYYAQQNSLAFAQTVIMLFENIDVKKAALNKMGVSVDASSLRRFDKSIRVVRESPQLITLETRAYNRQEAFEIWESLSSSVLEKSSKIVQQGDTELKVVRVNSVPAVRETYKSLVVFSVVGFGFGLTLGVLIALLKRYFK